VDALFSNGSAYYSPDGKGLGGTGSTIRAYSGAGVITAIVPALGGAVDALFSNGSAYYSPDGRNLGGGGNTISAYSGAGIITSLVPALGGAVDALFSNGSAYYSPDGKNLGGAGNTINAYVGAGIITSIVPVLGGAVDALFSNGSAYYSPDGKGLGGTGSTIRAYSGAGIITSIVPALGGAADTLFSGGSAYYSPDGRNLGGGGNTTNAYIGAGVITSLVPAPGGAVDALFSGGSAYYSPDGRNLGGGGNTVNAYLGAGVITVIVPALDGAVDALFSDGSAYHSPDGKNLGGGGNTVRLRSSQPALVSQFQNWSGYAAMPSNGQRQLVTAVSGTWTVPSITGVTGTVPNQSSTWVGIDGDGSPTVEQIGTAQDFAFNSYSGSGQAWYYAWYEMYPAAAVTITSMVIHPGDTMSAAVSYASGQFTLQIRDITTGQSFSTVQTAPSAQRASAEWVVEAPAFNNVPQIMPNFGVATFSAASATIGGVSGPINSPAWSHTSFNVGVPGAFNEDSTGPLNSSGGFSVTYNPLPFVVTYEAVPFVVHGPNVYLVEQGNLYQYSPTSAWAGAANGGWTELASGVQSASPGSNGALNVYFSDGLVAQISFLTGAWTYVS
jgi:hypothetical protein